MTRSFFTDVLFDLINESDLYDICRIEATGEGYQVTVKDGTQFDITVASAPYRSNVVPLFPERL